MPQTLAQLIRAKHPGAYDDLDDTALERSVKAKYPGVYDDLPTSSLPTRPFSAEDFAKPEPSRGWPAKLGDVAIGLGKSIIGGGIETARALSDLQRGAMGGDMEALNRTTERVKGIGAASADQFRKAVAAPTTSEFVGHALSSIPVVGPPIGQAGEKIAAGDWEGLGEGIGLVAAPFAPKILPAVGRGAQVAGKAAASGVRTVAPYVGDFASELPLAKTVTKPYERFAQNRARAAEIKTAKQLVDTPEAFAKRGGEHKTVPAPTRASGEQILSDVLDELVRADSASRVELPPPPGLPPGYQPRTDAPPLRVPENVGGRLVREKATTLPQVLSEALDEAAQAPPPARVTTPPPAGLPPGYTPRTTAPKPKLKPAPAATRKRPASPEMGPKGYFLRKPEPVAAMEPVEAVPMTEASLPSSWRGRTNQPLVSPNSATGQQWAAQFADELQARGLSAEEAITLVSKNPDLPPMVRLQIVSALKQVK